MVDMSDNAGANGAAARDLDVHITLVHGGLTNVKARVVVGARYDGLPFAGPTRVLDFLLDSWLSRAVDLGIIGSALGQLFPINLQQFHKADALKAQTLLLAGMGEPGRFAQDSLQFVISNIVVALRTLGETEFASPLLGTRRNELPIGQAVRSFVQGVSDGYDRIKAIVENITVDKEALRTIAREPLSIMLVQADERKLQQIEQELRAIAADSAFPNLVLTISRGEPVAADPKLEAQQADAEPDKETYLRITQSKSAAAGAVRSASASAPKLKKLPAREAMDMFPTDVFQFSALSEIAVVPQREQSVNSYLLSEIADRLTKEASPTNRARQGYFFTNLMVPDDFRRLIEGPAIVTLEVDATTAAYPWEMAACRNLVGGPFFAGTSIAMSRQFRTVLSPPPTSPPVLNNKLNVLIIADPAADRWALPGARREGEAVVDVLQRAHDAWSGQYEVKATVRISSCDAPDTALLDRLEKKLQPNGIVESVACCDPVELATLLVNDQYDVVHFAGHGVCHPVTQQTGWAFAPGCFLSAKEIFRVRQVPRMVFANACFSSVTSDPGKQRKQMAGMAEAFFARGIPNYIGAGWEVDDQCAVECARWFYARLLGLQDPDAGQISALPSEATIGRALLTARNKVRQSNPASSSWGAYQHYGHVGDRLVAVPNAAMMEAAMRSSSAAAPVTVQVSDAPPVAPGGSAKTPDDVDEKAPTTDGDSADPNLVFVNGINFRTGTYAFRPRSIGDIAEHVRGRPGTGLFHATRDTQLRALPFLLTEKLEQAGWGIVFAAGTPEPIRKALRPLIEFRRKRAGKLLQELEYSGEPLRDWLGKRGVSPGNPHPGKVPYYLLLVGPPDQIPFEFQYLLGIEYAVGRLSFDDIGGYERYAASTIAYESGQSAPNAKQIAYWATRHSAEPATKLSSTFLIDPLANGVPTDELLGQPVNKAVGYDQQLFLAKNATKASLLGALHADKPPALLFTASHGMEFDSGDAGQAAGQGALLCQDWPGIGEIKPEHFLAATDIGDDANVNGMIAFLFACYGAGTPDKDQFLMDLGQAATAPPPATKPFIAALPQRLLAHPRGSALAVIGHIDRAWGFSMQAPKVSDPQIETFRSSLESILAGTPVGHAISERFGGRYAELSALLLNQTSPTATAKPPSDNELVSSWLERNDAQNYVLLGDPAVSIRKDRLT